MNYILIVFMTFISAFASFFLKKSTTDEAAFGIFRRRYLYVGGLLYALSAMLNIWLLQRMPYFIVVSLGGICYIWTMLIARQFLGEAIGKSKCIGVGFILVGVMLIAI